MVECELVGVRREGMQTAVSGRGGKHLDLLVGGDGGKRERRRGIMFDDERGSGFDVICRGRRRRGKGGTATATGQAARQERSSSVK